MAKATVRCAIYTRKSSEEGLEQAFNSLDAQREACEAFVTSQKHEGWTALQTPYDDGGFSGGSLERPGVQGLLTDIGSGKVDVVVVYKVDRLTRSLADFAKIVEVFDGKGVSFVSVTQQFNTTTSMGRLTLNVLLSFAQFEREVTGERIRDKIAASKKKGMWMGGPIPIGYDLNGRSLLTNEAEAKTVRHIFERYAALGSVYDLKAELDRDGYVSKRRVSDSGRKTGGKSFSRGALYQLLQNRLYHGEIEHKGSVYPGQHEAIVEDDLWERVQAIIAGNRVSRETGAHAASPSLLAGLVFDENGERLTPTHANKRGVRYRYYVSARLVRGEQSEVGWRLPAADLEALVQDRVIQFLSNDSSVHDAVSEGADIDVRRRTVRIASKLASQWQALGFEKRRGILQGLVPQIVIKTDGIDLMLRSLAVSVITDPEFGPGMRTLMSNSDPDICIQVAAKMRRVGKGNALIIDGCEASAKSSDRVLLKLLSRAHRFHGMVLDGEAQSIQALADREGVSRPYLSALVRLAFLAPEITEAICRGEQPPTLTSKRLLQCAALPNSWDEQKRILGFSS